MKNPHHLSIKNGHLRINRYDCVVKQFESYKKVLRARYQKVQVLFAAKTKVTGME